MSAELMQWLINGERGLSSMAMVAHITGRGGDASYPYDPADLRRCRLLVERVPVIRHKLAKMSTCSPTWARIIAVWGELCALMDAEAPEWRQGNWSSAPQTHELLRRCREAQP
jgi:hypothetical protein